MRHLTSPSSLFLMFFFYVSCFSRQRASSARTRTEPFDSLCIQGLFLHQPCVGWFDHSPCALLGSSFTPSFGRHVFSPSLFSSFPHLFYSFASRRFPELTRLLLPYADGLDGWTIFFTTGRLGKRQEHAAHDCHERDRVNGDCRIWGSSARRMNFRGGM